MKIKKGDNVIIIAGKDKGKQSKVLKIMPGESKVLVEGIALIKKHQRPRKAGQKGQMVTMPSPIDVSNLMLFCKTCSKGVRVGYIFADERKVRICKKCKNEF